LKKYGVYPSDSVFDVFRVSYKESLSEMNTAQQFYYSNSTGTKRVNSAALEHIAGVGNSVVVQYEGSGAYFLDKVEPGVWRLELMPDAIQVRDPFERTSPERVVTRIEWNEHGMQVLLPDLGQGFSIKALNDGNHYTAAVTGDRFKIRPGTYLLVRNGKRTTKTVSHAFATPAAFSKDTTVYHAPLTAGFPEIFNPATDRNIIIYPWNRRNTQSTYTSGDEPARTLLNVPGFQFYCGDKLRGQTFNKLVIRARATGNAPGKAKLTFIDANAAAASTTVTISESFSNIEVPLNNLQPDSALLLPRPYPGFQPLWFKAAADFKLQEVEKIQLTTDPPSNIEIASIWMQKD
jgi:hypothetical protein